MFISSAKVKELHASGKQASGAVSAGAGVSINALVALLQGAPGKPEDTHGVLAAHMLKIANNQVRNVGTWAGNLALCFAHRDFQSDMATILAAVGATLSLVDASGQTVSKTLPEFFALADYCCLLSLTVPVGDPLRVLRTYKVMRRHQNAHAVVNAGFSVAVRGRTVGAAPVIVFGGILPGPARAPKTEALLVGKDWSAKATLAAALASLAAELVPDARPDVATRRALVSSLFYKYWVETLALHNLPVPKEQASAGVPYARPVSTSTEDYSTGVLPAVPKIEAHRQAAGEAQVRTAQFSQNSQNSSTKTHLNPSRMSDHIETLLNSSRTTKCRRRTRSLRPSSPRGCARPP
jgi:xanthine dehydrogenase iron-sulfur cluster and FAD-binding subunit A